MLQLLILGVFVADILPRGFQKDLQNDLLPFWHVGASADELVGSYVHCSMKLRGLKEKIALYCNQDKGKYNLSRDWYKII